jgi:cellobiose PTS system EIIB component
MKILLVCAAGISTSLIKVEMIKNSEEGTIIDTCSYYEFEERINDYDIFLVAPQLGYHLEKMKKIARGHHKAVAGIDPLAYGRCLGKQVYEQAKQLYQAEKEGSDEL